jgi:hypothetical protein
LTDTNFIKSVFANGANLALSQQAISQGIINQEIKLNETSLPIISDIGELCNITSQYWDREQVMSEIQASIPDRFIDVASYTSNAVKFVDVWGTLPKLVFHLIMMIHGVLKSHLVITLELLNGV